MFGVILLAGVLLLSFTFVDERLSRLVNRWLFRPPDYRAATRGLANRLGQLQLESEIAAAAEDAARDALQLSGARLIAVDSLPASPWSPAILEGEMVELDHADPVRGRLPVANAEVLIPVTSAGRITHVLVVSPGPARPGLVSHDLNFLRAVAAQFGNRLDTLHREREAIERQSREALLLQQVAEAELRALRAQINPHFLFNSLNTIADLIVRDPLRAEAMTLRLASVFRHVLAHSSRSMTTIREEVEFLRTYLYIEEARFGDRLRVTIDVAPEAAGQSIPSLILQPLVENAMKHGLGPKPGPGNIWISAHIEGDQVCVRIEDDGMGPQSVPAAAPDECHGLTNVAGRLRTLYRDRASVTLEAREGGGACVTVRIPRGGSESGMRSIIVDDEESARARLGRMLAAHPDIVVVGEARDGLEAVEKIEALQPDLLFLDIQMPGLTGFEVLQSIPPPVAMPLVIFVTGYDQHALAAFEANALAYLLKPVEAGAAGPGRGARPQTRRNHGRGGARTGARFCGWRANRPKCCTRSCAANATAWCSRRPNRSAGFRWKTAW